jgi:hypothetical protein
MVGVASSRSGLGSPALSRRAIVSFTQREDTAMNFEKWLAKLLGQRAQDVQRLIGDETALHFLIAWSLFESKCFAGFAKLNEISSFCERIVKVEGFDPAVISDTASHFHARYQDAGLYDHLMYGKTSSRMDAILKRPFESLSAEERVFVTALTAYRYRNNIFHGNKGVDSWLQFRPQIKRCIEAMQAFVDHAEKRVPSLRTPAAA